MLKKKKRKNQIKVLKMVDMGSQILEKIGESIDLSQYRRIYVGFSGGADSTALLLALNILSANYKYELIAVHFEHGIRGAESLSDMQWCENFCSNNNIKFHFESLNVNRNIYRGEGVEECARRLRIETWRKIVKSKKGAIALGHHRDDKVENFFLRMLRGSNSSGLTSLRHVFDLDGIIFIRPFLEFKKSSIFEFLNKYNIMNIREDSSNAESCYRRNILRNKILPYLYKLIPPSEEGICRAVEAVGIDADCLEKIALERYKNQFSDPYKLKVEDLRETHPAIRSRVLRYWLGAILGREFIPDRNFLIRVDRELKKNMDKRHLLPFVSGKFMCFYKNAVTVVEDDVAHDGYTKKRMKWNWKKSNSIEFGGDCLKAMIMDQTDIAELMNKDETIVFFDSELISETLALRFRQDGDRMLPFDSDKERRLKKVLSSKKVSIEKRSLIPLLTTEDDIIIWVAGVMRSDFARVTGKSKSIVQFCCSQVRN